jgi:hypothetical protein
MEPSGYMTNQATATLMYSVSISLTQLQGV